jgi:hypothetical protein
MTSIDVFFLAKKLELNINYYLGNEYSAAAVERSSIGLL